MISRLQQQIHTRRVPTYWILEHSPSRIQRRQRQRRTAWCLVATMLTLLLGAHLVYAQPAGVQQQGMNNSGISGLESSALGLSDIGSGALLFRTATAGRYVPASSQQSEAQFEISGSVARVVLRQSFSNDTGDWQEAVYVFPLPDEAAVNEMRIRIGERLIEGEIHERQQAKAIYQKARAEGRKAGLVEQQRPNMFTTSVANIGPGEVVQVELAYLQPVSYDSGEFSLRFPMTITPRYMPGELSEDEILAVSTHGWAKNTDQVPDASAISPFQAVPGDQAQIRVSGQVDIGMPMHSLQSPYHQLQLTRQDNSYRFELATAMSQDFVLNWRPAIGSEPEAAVFTEQIDDEHYLSLLMVPPHQRKTVSAGALAKEQIFIIDTSGSMAGVSIEQARSSLILALERLAPQDSFNIIEFDSTTRAFSGQAVAASVHNIARARQMVNSLQADGGTEMLPALRLAMNSQPYEAQRLRQIVFITDGAVGNEQALFKTIQKELADSRLFMVGIGSAPNSHFMRKASQFGRGSFTHIGDISEVHNKMHTLLDKLESPVVSGLSIEWPSGVDAESYPQALPDLYLGEPLSISSKLADALPEGAEMSVTIKGQTAGKPWRRELRLQGTGQGSQGVAALWARRKIEALLDSRVTGANEAQIKPQVLNIALAHRLISPYTSFVAVEQQRSRPEGADLKSSAVPNTKPKGQLPQTFAYPQGSTGARSSFVWGALLLIMVLVLRFSVKAESRHVLPA